MVYGTYNELITGAYKPTNITGGPHIVYNIRYIMTIHELYICSVCMKIPSGNLTVCYRKSPF